ncbi:MAG TPA: hypothetical protein VLF94_04525 [Chlamydiales bacterium]|nr:hypothetical protein [Chlamydiales bacterium]
MAASAALKTQYLRTQVLFETPGPFHNFAFELDSVSPAWKTAEERTVWMTQRVRKMTVLHYDRWARGISGDDFQDWIGETLRLSGVQLQVGKVFGREDLIVWVRTAITCLNTNQRIRDLFGDIIGSAVQGQIINVHSARKCAQLVFQAQNKERGGQIGYIMSDIVREQLPFLTTQDDDDAVLVDVPLERICEDINVLGRWVEKPLGIFKEGYPDFADV